MVSIFTVLYGSETGTAKELAESFVLELYTRCLSVRLFSLDKYPLDQLIDEKCIFFFVATAGQGEPPKNMQRFWRFLLRSDLPPIIFSSIRFAVFGLGDSSYIKFNYMGKMLFKRLEILGATALVPRGEGDDQHPFGQLGAFDPWKELLWTSLEDFCQIPMGQFSGFTMKEAHYIPKFTLNPSIANKSLLPILPHTNPSAYGQARMVSYRRLTSLDHFQDVEEYLFELCDPKMRYVPSDTFDLVATNDTQDVERLLEWMGWQEYAPNMYHLDRNRPDASFPDYYDPSKTLAFFNVLTDYLHISHYTPTQSFFRWLAIYYQKRFPNMADHQLNYLEKLQLLGNKKGLDEWLDYCWRPKRRALEIIEEFHINFHRDNTSVSALTTAAVEPELVFDLFPWIRPRSFSISSSPNALEKSTYLTITVALVEFKNPSLKSPRIGFCSSYLKRVCTDSASRCRISHSSIHLHTDSSTPLLLLCSGTGIALIRALIQDRIMRASTENPPVGPMYLFFGCRYLEKDNLYCQELKEFASTHATPLYIYSAGSRDVPGKRKKYLQDTMADNKDLIYDLILNQGAFVYLCGNTKLPGEVRSVLTSPIFYPSAHFETLEKAQHYLCELEDLKRFQMENW